MELFLARFHQGEPFQIASDIKRKAEPSCGSGSALMRLPSHIQNSEFRKRTEAEGSLEPSAVLAERQFRNASDAVSDCRFVNPILNSE